MSTVTDREILDTLAGAIRRGRRLAVPASGLSMGRTFRDADALVIASVEGARLFPGRVVVYQRGDRWTVHRVMWVFGSSSPYRCVTKGDGLSFLDRPFVRRDECIGVVVGIQRAAEVRDLTTISATVLGIGRVCSGAIRVLVHRLIGRRRFSERSAVKDPERRTGTPPPPDGPA